MEYQEENMECSESLNIREILSEARRKLLKYRRKKWVTEQEDLKELFMYDDDTCPECDALMISHFQCLDTKRYIFQCCQCKSYFIPDEDPKNSHKRRKTE